MPGNATFTVRMDKEIKTQSESIFNELGVNLTTAINVFLRKAIQAGGFPFDVRNESPNKETLQAIEESERIIKDIKAGKHKTFDSWEDAKKELLS